MATFDELNRQAAAARARGDKPFSASQYANASYQERNLMNTIANKGD